MSDPYTAKTQEDALEKKETTVSYNKNGNIEEIVQIHTYEDGSQGKFSWIGEYNNGFVIKSSTFHDYDNNGIEDFIETVFWEDENTQVIETTHDSNRDGVFEYKTRTVLMAPSKEEVV